MDAAGQNASDLLNALGAIRRTLMDRAMELRRHPLVKKVLTGVYPHVGGIGEPCIVEGYVDTTLNDGASIRWQLTLRWNAHHWIVESGVTGTPGNALTENQPLLQFPDRIATTIPNCIEQLYDAIEGLFAQSLEATIAFNI